VGEHFTQAHLARENDSDDDGGDEASRDHDSLPVDHAA
jgi:hypothetical protein